MREEVVDAILDLVLRDSVEQAGHVSAAQLRKYVHAEDSWRTILETKDALEDVDGVLTERALLGLVPRPLPVDG
jgi:uncharacterized phage-associated protein